MKKYKHSFLVSRFQPLHNGHKALIDKMISESENATIVLGTAQESRTEKNPFTAEERIEMVKNLYKDNNNINVFAINDLDYSENRYNYVNTDWSTYVIDNITKNSPHFGKVEAFYCGGSFEGSWYENCGVVIEILDRTKQEGYCKISATEIREMIKNNNDDWKNYIPKENIELIKKLLCN